MADQATDFLKDYQSMAQQSWDAWTRYLQQHSASSTPFGATASPFGPAATGDDLMARSMAALKGYGDWLQGAVGSGLGQGPADWQQSLQQLFRTWAASRSGMRSPASTARRRRASRRCGRAGCSPIRRTSAA